MSYRYFLWRPVHREISEFFRVRFEHFNLLFRELACVYRQLKRGRSGDEVRPGWRVN
jgi:hypothetical protein